MVRHRDHFISHKMIFSGSRLTVNYSDIYSDELLWRDCNDISDITSVHRVQSLEKSFSIFSIQNLSLLA